jgi:hypothetical protein
VSGTDKEGEPNVIGGRVTPDDGHQKAGQGLEPFGLGDSRKLVPDDGGKGAVVVRNKVRTTARRYGVAQHHDRLQRQPPTIACHSAGRWAMGDGRWIVTAPEEGFACPCACLRVYCHRSPEYMAQLGGAQLSSATPTVLLYTVL